MKSPKPQKDRSPMPERYFNDLANPLLCSDGKYRQSAPTRFIELLRLVHSHYRPRFNLSQILIAGTGAKNVWFWSDQHFCHANIIGFANRPFNSVDEMNAALADNYRSRVQKEDIVVFGGDIQLKDLAAANRILRDLPGYKILILGNHDVRESGVLRLAVDEIAACLEIEYQGRSLFLTHYPIRETMLEPMQINVHGHLHDTPLPAAIGSGSRHVNMSVEHTGYAPVLIENLLAGR